MMFIGLTLLDIVKRLFLGSYFFANPGAGINPIIILAAFLFRLLAEERGQPRLGLLR